MKRLLLAVLVAAPRAWSAPDAGLPLPAAPIRLVIPDPAAFDAALTGAYRRALTGEADEDDPVVSGWRQSRVGAKLEAQWSKLSGELPWSWTQIRALKPRAVGLALLDVGHLEAVLVVETPLAVLPVAPPAGASKTHAGLTYHLVARGAADAAPDPDRRAGLAWARSAGRLLLATSERALLLALDESLAGRGFAAPLAGLVSLDLDMDALGKDRYFRREFVMGGAPETGHIRAALRLEAGGLVEVREGAGGELSAGYVFDAPNAAAAGWEPDGSGLFPALRAALLEPVPVLSERPVASIVPLPSARRAAEDRYLVSLETPLVVAGAAPTEAGELGLWRALFERPVGGWGWVIGADGTRRIVFEWPEARQDELERLCRATTERRAGRAGLASVKDAREVRVGPGLPALAFRRTGAFVWVGPSARELAGVSAPRLSADLVRWARLDLDAVRSEGARWPKAEGPASPESVRPFSDRVLGLLGWMPATHSLAVERRKTAEGWSERVVFGAPR